MKISNPKIYSRWKNFFEQKIKDILVNELADEAWCET